MAYSLCSETGGKTTEEHSMLWKALHFMADWRKGPVDRWHGASYACVSWFQTEFDAIAVRLSRPKDRVEARFDQKTACAELVTSRGDVLARARILLDEYGLPKILFVTTKLVERERMYFRQLIAHHPYLSWGVRFREL